MGKQSLGLSTLSMILIITLAQPITRPIHFIYDSDNNTKHNQSLGLSTYFMNQNNTKHNQSLVLSTLSMILIITLSTTNH